MSVHDMSYETYLATYVDPDRPIIEIDVDAHEVGKTPWIIVKSGDNRVILATMGGLGNHLCVDAYPFVDDKYATVAAFGMSEGVRTQLDALGTTSHGWNSAAMVALLVGE